MFDFSSLSKLRNDLNRAIVNNDLDLFSRLVKASDDCKERLHNLNYLDTEGQTPLHRTCYHGNLAFIKLLVENGANQHIQNKDGWYPVHLASYYGHSEIVKYLLSEDNSATKLQVFESEPTNKKRTRDQFDPGIPTLKRPKVEPEPEPDVESSDDDSFDTSSESCDGQSADDTSPDNLIDSIDPDIYLTDHQNEDYGLEALDSIDIVALE